MGYALPILLGAVCGFLGALPYLVVVIYLKRKHAVDILPGIGALMCSLVIAGVSILVAWYVARASLLVFAIAFVVVFLIAIVIAVVWFMHRPQS